MTLGQRISELRKERGYAQEYVAEQMGVSRQAVSKWETDQCAPDTYNLIALSELFGVTVEYLATGKPQNQVPPQPQTAQTVVQMGHPPLLVWQIIDIVMLAVGLLSAVLGIVLELFLLLIFAGALVIGAAVDLSFKHSGLIGLWTQWVYYTLVMSFTTGGPLRIFSLFYHENGFEVSRLEMVSLLYWVWLVINIVLTVWVLRRRKK